MAVLAIAVSAILFAIAAPFAKQPLGQFPAFLPSYVSALVICDGITVVLLLGQFSRRRSPSLLVLAGAYVFTASMTAAYALMFPGLYTPAGLLGAGPQSTSAMYMFWHAGFPLAVIAYTLLERGASIELSVAAPIVNWRSILLLSVVAVLVLVCGFTLFVTSWHDALPTFIEGNQTSALGRRTLTGVWMLSLFALLLLLGRRPYSVMDLWLIVVMFVWLFDIALSALLNTGRYDLGWYVGRIYGLVGASGLLVMLLIENISYYKMLVRVSAQLHSANNALQKLSMQDGLTHIANRRSFDSHLAKQIAIARRHDRELSLVLCDVDAFKAYNDEHGHLAGDECLKQVAATLNGLCRRPADLAARYGGEEFALILPDTNLAGALVIAEAARSRIAALDIPHPRSDTLTQVTISGGCATLRGLEISAEGLIATADQRLFQAKDAGRNQIISADD